MNNKIIIITILSILTITLGIGTIYFFNVNRNSQEQIKELQNKVKELEKEIEDYSNTNNEELVENIEQEDSTYSNLIGITVEEFTTLINKKESFILLASQTFCSHCKDYKPIFNKTLKEHNITAYIIEYDLLTPDEHAAMDAIIDVPSTPTTIFFQNGVEARDYRLDKVVGQVVIEANLRATGYIK